MLWVVNRIALRIGILVFVANAIGGHLLADGRDDARSTSHQEQEATVFVTGSLIPKRVKLRRIGTKTTSPVHVIDRNEIDQNGRPSTPEAFRNDPSVRLIGH
jgi:hypothetical protein